MLTTSARALFEQPVLRSALSAWRELAWISGGQILGALGAIVGVRLLTSVLPPSAYGEFTLGMTTATLAFQVLLGPLVNAFERYYGAARETGHDQDFLHAARRLTARASLLIAVLGVIVSGGLALLGQATWLPLAGSAIIFAVLSGWEAALDGIQNAARKRGSVASHQALRQWLRPVLAVVLVSVMGATSAIALAGYVLASLTILGSQLWFFRRTLRPARTSETGSRRSAIEQQMLSYATPFGLWGLFTWTQMASDRWALDAFRSSTEVGRYAILLQLGSYPLTLLGGMLTQSAMPIIFAQAGEGSDLRRIKNAIQLCAFIAVGIFVVTVLFATVGFFAHAQLFAVLVGAQYRSVSFLFPLAVLASGLFVVGQVLSIMPMALGESQGLLLPKIVTAVLAVVMNVVGAYFYGAAGLLWASLVFALAYGLWVMFVTRELFKARQASALMHVA